MSVQPIPPCYHTVTPFLSVNGAAKLIDFLKQAFEAVERERVPGPNGSIAHAEVKIGDSILMLGDACDDYGPTTGAFYLYVPNVDEVYKRALAAGGESLMEPTNQFWGDRQAGVKDSFGARWFMATRVEDVSREELEKRMAAASNAG